MLVFFVRQQWKQQLLLPLLRLLSQQMLPLSASPLAFQVGFVLRK
jgi:hypothetical protein